MAWSIFSNGGGDQAAASWAEQFLQQIGAPTSQGNVQFVYDWEKSEGGGGLNNPLNTGAVSGLAISGNQYGGGSADYPSIGAGIQAAVDVLGEGYPGYSQIVSSLKANNPSGAQQALFGSPWAGSHYGYGSNWSTAVPPVGGGGVSATNQRENDIPASGGGAGVAAQPDPLGQQLQTLSGLYGPQLALSQAGYQQQVDALQGQLATYQQQIPYQQGLEQQALGYQLGQYGIQQSNLGLSQQGLAAQEQLAGQQYGLEQQQYGLTQQQFGLQGQQIGLSGQSLAEQLAQAQTSYGQGLRNLGQQTAAAGTYNTGTQAQGASDLATQLAFAQQSNQIGQAGLGLQRQGLGISEQQAALNQQGAANQYAYQQGAFGLQGQQLANQAKSIDLSSQQAKTSAAQAIASLGLQGQISEDQVLQAIGAAQSGQAGALTGVLPQILTLMTGGA